jgi:IclR family pca regulon transcriptional regulator
VTVSPHAAETSVETLLEHHLPLLLQAAGAMSADLAMLNLIPRSPMGDEQV